MNQFGCEHPADLSIKLMIEYLHETVLPQMVATEKNGVCSRKRTMQQCNNALARGMSQDEYDEAATKTLK